MRRLRPTALAVVLLLTVLPVAGLLGSASPAGAAGITTHAWMGLSAIDRVTVPELKALLEANRDYVRAGAQFPDSGYWPGNHYGEEAHWQRFADSYLARIQARSDCGDLTAPHGPCAPEIAHLLGDVAHGMGDEVWDWLFEPNSPDLDEYYLPPEFQAIQGPGGQELQLDIVAVALHDQPLDALVAPPVPADIKAAYTDVGSSLPQDEYDRGQEALNLIHAFEAAYSPSHIDPLVAAMPWMSNNVVTAPGGVNFAAQAIAGYWESMWGRLLGSQPQTEVSITYPAPDQRRIPASGWDRDMLPGSDYGRGGARTRIAAALTYSRPYVAMADSGGHVDNQLPAGSMTLTDESTDELVPARSGYPRSVPYGADSGEHVVGFQPAGDLTPCTWYRVDITTALVDARDEAVAPHSWRFRTGADGAGARCPDDPYTHDENYVRKGYQDVLDREAEPAGLADWTYHFDRGTSHGAFAQTLLYGPEHTGQLVEQAYERFLGRSPSVPDRDYWVEVLRTYGLVDLQTALLASDEAYAAGGGTDAGFVTTLYQRILFRDPEPGGLAFWTAALAGGLPRGDLPRRLLTSDEAARNLVAAGYQQLLDRAPEGGGLEYWTALVRGGADIRGLWAGIIASPEYEALADVP